ncbi:hypothetical protein H5410_007547 [Solanum commersonii]|uniref:Uncharacterized protein n=1 Tax=Solanum commersonii TaxID=4109 RepID=A0A9J6ACZ9_SOLCO|nr:hypothetical protein H5410_007547 [Solanum commersonii]
MNGDANEHDHAQNGGANKQVPNNEDRENDNEQNDDGEERMPTN